MPQGGPRGVEVGIRGTSDLPITVVGEQLVFGGVSARTAQVAPAIAPAITPFPRAASPADGASAANPAGQATVDPGPAPLVAVAAVLALAIGGVGLLAVAVVRRTRTAGRVAAPPRAPGA